MGNIKRKQLLRCIIVVVIIVIVSVFACFYQYKDEPSSPTISVGVRELEIEGTCITLKWTVKNKSEQTVTFDANQIVWIELNGKHVVYPTEFVAIAPDEEIILNLLLYGAKENQINNLEISAISNEGTTATFRQTIYSNSR